MAPMLREDPPPGLSKGAAEPYDQLEWRCTHEERRMYPMAALSTRAQEQIIEGMRLHLNITKIEDHTISTSDLSKDTFGELDPEVLRTGELLIPQGEGGSSGQELKQDESLPPQEGRDIRSLKEQAVAQPSEVQLRAVCIRMGPVPECVRCWALKGNLDGVRTSYGQHSATLRRKKSRQREEPDSPPSPRVLMCPWCLTEAPPCEWTQNAFVRQRTKCVDCHATLHLTHPV